MILGFVLVNPNSQQFGTTSPSGQGYYSFAIITSNMMIQFYMFKSRFIQVMNQPMARSEDAANNDTYYCPYSNPDQTPPNPIKALPTPKSSEGSTFDFTFQFNGHLKFTGGYINGMITFYFRFCSSILCIICKPFGINQCNKSI